MKKKNTDFYKNYPKNVVKINKIKQRLDAKGRVYYEATIVSREIDGRLVKIIKLIDAKNITKLKLGVDDYVEIDRKNTVVSLYEKSKVRRFAQESKCAYCDTPLGRKWKKYQKCENKYCKEVIYQKTLLFVGVYGINLKNPNKTTIRKIINNELITKPMELLDIENIVAARHSDFKIPKTLIDSIKAIKPLSYKELLSIIMSHPISIKLTNQIWNKYGSIWRLITDFEHESDEDIVEIIKHVSNVGNQEFIIELLENVGVNYSNLKMGKIHENKTEIFNNSWVLFSSSNKDFPNNYERLSKYTENITRSSRTVDSFKYHIYDDDRDLRGIFTTESTLSNYQLNSILDELDNDLYQIKK